MKPVSPVALSTDLRGQLQQLRNAFSILAKPEHPWRNQASDLRREASSVWQFRASQQQWFSWPTTDAPKGTQRLNAAFRREKGMLDLLGYHVGMTQPTSAEIRRQLLEYTFEYHLPPMNDRAYCLEWGEPGTATRLQKLANTLATFARNAKRHDEYGYAKAIGDWEHDLALLHEGYYLPMFSFGWPATEIFH